VIRTILGTGGHAKERNVVRRSPQEKKALSYSRDRRNDYGENDKSSRRNIRRGKQLGHRSNRHHEHRILRQASGGIPDAELAGCAETTLLGRRPSILFRKFSDAPLGAVVIGTLRRRAERGFADHDRVEMLIERIRRRIPPR
jgi:hypothetical protein